MYTATQCNTLRHTAAPTATRTATHDYTLRHTATHHHAVGGAGRQFLIHLFPLATAHRGCTRLTHTFRPVTKQPHRRTYS